MSYQAELETKIDYHLTKAASLIEWKDLLLSDPSFDWSNVTDEQKYIIDNFPCDKVPQKQSAERI